MSDFISAYVSATGEKVRVPAHYVDHPVLWRGLRKTPLTSKREAESAATPKTPTPAAKADTERND